MLTKKARTANKKSPTVKYAMHLLKGVIKDLKDGNCTEEEVVDALGKFNPENRGYIKEDDYMNYDEACVALGIGWNRNRLNALCKKYGVINHKFNNAHIGFAKRDIMKLKVIIQETKE